MLCSTVAPAFVAGLLVIQRSGDGFEWLALHIAQGPSNTIAAPLSHVWTCFLGMVTECTFPLLFPEGLCEAIEILEGIK